MGVMKQVRMTVLMLAVVSLNGNLNLKGCPTPGCDSVRTPRHVELLVEVPGFVRQLTGAVHDRLK